MSRHWRWNPDDPSDLTIRLFPEHGTRDMLWDGDGIGHAPEELRRSPLRVSKELCDALHAWAARYHAFRPHRRYLHAEDDPEFDLDAHNAEGERLAEWLQREMTPAWTVTHLKLARGPALVGGTRLTYPRKHYVPLAPALTAVEPDPPLDDFGTEEPPQTVLREGMLSLHLHPTREKGLSYLVQALWRGDSILPPGLVREVEMRADNGMEGLVTTRETMFAAFAAPLLRHEIGRWDSTNDDVSLTVLPAHLSPYARRFWDVQGGRYRLSDPPEHGFEVNLLFRAGRERGYAGHLNGGLALRMTVTRAALNRFMVAFAREHDALNLRDEAESEEQGRYVRARFTWPPEREG